MGPFADDVLKAWHETVIFRQGFRGSLVSAAPRRYRNARRPNGRWSRRGGQPPRHAQGFALTAL